MHKAWTVAEKERLAELVAAGTPLGEITELIGRDRWTTRRNINHLARRPAPERKRSPLRLSLAEREEISRGIAAGESLRTIARRLGPAPSTVSREISANGGVRRYRAVVADRAALRRACRPKLAKLAVQPELCAVVEAKLEQRWSPQQISTVCSASTSQSASRSRSTRPELDAVADELNGRPRQTLRWQTPSQALDQALLR